MPPLPASDARSRPPCADEPPPQAPSGRKPAGTIGLALVAALAALPAGRAQAIESEFGRCRNVADATARLACYDAIPYVAAAQPGSAAASASAPAARHAAPAAAPPGAASRFGLARPSVQDELASLTSSVSAEFTGWGPNERIRLENGQIWEVVDASAGSVGPTNRKVTVRRGALGSYFLEFEGLNRSPRVRRIQ